MSCCKSLEATKAPTASTWNVIGETEFKKKVREVFKAVSDALTNTLGPYGSTTIIEKFGEMHITKDGWQVLKNIRFEDPVCNNILMLLLRISSQVVIKVGDGSTSSIVAANSILEEMEKKTELHQMRPKDFMRVLNECVEAITTRIYEGSTKIDKTTYDEIHKLAYIATNGDEDIANMIKDIYIQTSNPTIEYVKSKTDKTYYEVIEGYKINNLTFIDSIFTTNDNGTCHVDKPLFLLFDHKVDIETSMPLISAAAQKAIDANTRLVVVAPHYDKFLLDQIRQQISVEYKVRGTSSIVYTRVGLVNNISHEIYNDFAIMCGADIIREQYIRTMDMTRADVFISEYIGETDDILITPHHSTIKGFTKRNPNMYLKIIEDATSKYIKLEEEYRDRGMIDMKLTELKNRATKLKGAMGIIHVGGYSSLEKSANYDLVEDAIKACESAYLHGYNCGGNLIIPYTVHNILKEETPVNDNVRHMYSVIEKAFRNVFKTVLLNKMGNESSGDICDEIRLSTHLETIIDTCLFGSNSFPQCYDLITDQYSRSIINSCITDIEILKATASIISLLVSSNQYISITSNSNT